jgi:hypothetical protein
MQMLNRSLAVAILVSSVACAPVQPYEVVPAYEASLITLADIQANESGTALDVVRKVRPNFLTSRGATNLLPSSTLPALYIDGMRHGDISLLSQIPAKWIAEMRMYRLGNTAQFGINNQSGVLAITTRRR